MPSATKKKPWCLFILFRLLLSFLSFVTFIFTHFKKGATAPFKLGGHPVQKLVRKRKRGNGHQYLVLWGDGTKDWAPAGDIEKEPELLRAFEKSL